MFSSQYSPFDQSNFSYTGKHEATSYKKYPANKYDDPTDIKHQLFHDKYATDAHRIKDKQLVFFKNPKLNQSIYGSQPDSVIQTSRHLLGQKYDKTNDYSQLINQYEKGHNQIKQKNKKSHNKSKKLRSKSCQLSVKQTKRTLIQIKQSKQEELQMYKKLCLTLKKQNEDLQTKISKKQKEESKFSSQVQKLKEKIRKMYDHCIEKNKSSKNVDIDLKHLIKTYTGKEKRYNKENNSLFANGTNLHKSSQFQNPKTRQSSKTINLNKKGNKQTIDSSRAQNRDLITESYRENNNGNKKIQKLNKFAQIQLKKSLNSYRNIQNESFKPPAEFPQYDQTESDRSKSQIPDQVNNSQNPYQQFFKTFTKSLEIFQSSHQKKIKAKNLKQAGYGIQWAKQQWLEIVQYLIQKGYNTGNQLKKTKIAESTLKSIR